MIGSGLMLYQQQFNHSEITNKWTKSLEIYNFEQHYKCNITLYRKSKSKVGSLNEDNPDIYILRMKWSLIEKNDLLLWHDVYLGLNLF